MLPRRDGLEVLADVRRTRPTLPVIILTARGSEDDRVRGLKMGADDYIVKPFSARELLARVEAVLRRSLGRPTEVQGARLGRAVIDLAAPRNPLVRTSETANCPKRKPPSSASSSPTANGPSPAMNC